MKDNFIDLHVHSTASDGTTPPWRLVEAADRSIEKALEEGWIPVKPDRMVLALTDHDTVQGIPALLESVKNRPDVTIIPGVEISTEYNDAKGNHEIHILGLGVDPSNENLLEGLRFYREGRHRRNLRILEKFQSLGIHIPEKELYHRPGEAVGRLHIARWLVEHGEAESIKDAFDRYLNPGEVCYFEREKLSQEESIKLILEAGGIPVLAHPVRYHFMNQQELETLVRHLKKLGLQGIETYYTVNTPEQTQYLEMLAKREKLIRTGGSDYHGSHKPGYHLGFGHGNLGETMDRIDLESLVRL